jgi:hypothetical protein
MGAMPAFAGSHPDDDPLRGPTAVEAREALDYWRARARRLPRHRLAGRREARAMAVRWEERLRRAESDRWGGGLPGWAAGHVAVLRTDGPARLVRRGVALVPTWIKATFLAVAAMVVLTCGLVAVAIVSALT